MAIWDATVTADRPASEHPEREETLSLSFQGGIDRKNPPQLIADGACRDIFNMYYPRETAIPRTRPGLAVYEDDTGTGTTVTAVHIYRYSSTVSYLCYTTLASNVQALYAYNGTDTLTLSADLGSTAKPCLATFNGCLVVALAGHDMYEWQGFTGTSPAAAHGGDSTGSVTFTNGTNVGLTVTIGSEVWEFTDDAEIASTTAYYVLDDASAATCAANLLTAINRDSVIVYATASTPADETITLKAYRVGVAGNLTVSSNANANTVNMTGGVDGLALDAISTYQAPHPAFIVPYQRLQLLVGAGDPSDPDTVYFSSPRDHWQWAVDPYGAGATFTLGSTDGCDVTAVHPMLGTLVIHKAGQGREIYRININDVDPTTWTSNLKEFPAQTAAVNWRCTARGGDKHLYLDKAGFASLSGTDTYDEIIVSLAGSMIARDLSEQIVATTAFMVHNPDENYVLVFPASGKSAWCYHTGTGRWTRWVFSCAGNLTCGCYSENLGTLLFGTDDAQVLKLDDSIATDDGISFSSRVITRALGSNQMADVLIKQTLLDWKHILAGSGRVSVALKREDSPSQLLFDFTVTAAAPLLIDLNATHLDDATMLLLSEPYGRSNSFEQGGGPLPSLHIQLTSGAFELNAATLRVAYTGRATQ